MRYWTRGRFRRAGRVVDESERDKKNIKHKKHKIKSRKSFTKTKISLLQRGNIRGSRVAIALAPRNFLQCICNLYDQINQFY